MMKIGIDLRPLQTGHRFRGVGEVTKQTTNRILAAGVRDGHSFVFYEFEDANDPRDFLDLPKGITYEIVKVGKSTEGPEVSGKAKLAGQLKLMYGTSIPEAGADVFLQYDYALGVPKHTRTVLVKHDLIPLVFWKHFFSSPLTHIRNKALRTTLKTIFRNHAYRRILRRSLKDAGTILTVSAHTKKDLARYLKISEHKMKVAQLGVSLKPAKTDAQHKQSLPTKPYLLFVGGIDVGKRRAVDDIVHAYNNLKAAGHDIQLVLVGENFQEEKKIPHEKVRTAIMKSSYKNDILLMGYIDDATKQRLYKGAIAFVYPTKYEGFGIPVLEGMLMECPVIAYKNSSIPEVGGDFVWYAHDWQTIKEQVEKLLAMKESERKKRIAAAKRHAESFTWDKTAEIIYQELTATS